MQKKICDYLLKINQQFPDKNSLQNALQTNDFLIGEEVSLEMNNSTSARYFKIFFNEIRRDQHFLQITPEICFRTGYLQIDSDGTILLKDSQFNFYRSSKVFYFDQNEDKLKFDVDWNIANEEQLSSKCAKGLLSIGFFAAAATLAYGVANENIQFKMN